jgi:Excalibur calcium-binding domain
VRRWLDPVSDGDEPVKISYANGVGDHAIWDARNLSAPPTTRTKEADVAKDAEPDSRAGKSAKNYENCDALTDDYPHGVGRPDARDKTADGSPPVTNFERNDSLYEANTDSDRDRDGIACERH